MDSDERVDVVLPCLDEALSLPYVLERMPPGYRVIVADNGSTDGSGELARSHGATVVDVPQRGFGAAAHAGLLAAAADTVCFMDCDGSLDPAELPVIVAEVRSGRADLAMGRRRPESRSAWPLHARAGNAVVTWRLRRRFGVTVRDLGPMRAARRTQLLDLDLVDRRFGYPLEMVATAARRGWRITEIDVGYRVRTAGSESKVTGNLPGTLHTVRDMGKVLAR